MNAHGSVVDGLAGDRHVVGVHDAVDEPDEHPLRDEGRLGGDDRLEQREVRRSASPRRRVVRRIAWSASRRSRSGSPVAAAYSKLPTRRWLLATRASTAPGQQRLAAHKTAGRDDREGRGWWGCRERASPADDVLPQHRADRGEAVAAAREGCAPGALEVQVAQAPVGVHELTEQQRTTVAETRGRSRRTGARRRPGRPGWRRRGRRCRGAVARPRGCAAQRGRGPARRPATR